MCFPPFCKPAQHVLGCFGLRQGATGVLFLNAFYGLAMVVLHGILLGEISEGTARENLGGGGGGAEAEEGPAALEEGFEEEAERRLEELAEQATGWMTQVMDLDIGWGHQILGFDDQTNMISGLIYGVVILLVSLYMLHAMHWGPSADTFPTISRWFVAFLNLQVVLFAGLVLVKMPKLCRIQRAYLTHLDMECEVLRFLFVQRAAIMLIAASLCVWVFSSFSFVLTFGDTGHLTVDRPEYSQQVEAFDWQRTQGAAGAPPPGSMPGPGAGGSRAPVSQHPGDNAWRRSMVGGATAVRNQSMAGGRSAAAPSRSPAGMTRMPIDPGPVRGPSYNVGRMPRASSSMTTGYSETQALLKPPVAVF
mmetsp:Transcript_66842/g.196216  ORF Transcript_66842/g.196216 Transcript_66842/m.196216 type:complete len:363 (+) Transcript_66842:112-1200(+)